jgi:hypothetical protein
VRIPIPWVLFFSIIIVAGVWWHETRYMDFMTPPPASKLAEIRRKAEVAVPSQEHDDNAVAPPAVPVPEPPPPEPPKPEIEFGDLDSPPSIKEYQDQASTGSAHLIELARSLEAKGEFQRALLAWERVLDTGKSDENQVKTAVSTIKRLRPTLPDWNIDPKKTIAVILHAGAGKKTAKILKPVLEKTAGDLERASAGILKITVEVTAGRDIKSSQPPIALWITGPDKKSRSTDVLSFTLESKDKLAQDVEKTIFQIIRGFIGHGPSQTPPPAISEGELPMEAIQSHITRLFWMDLGNRLNHPPE